MQVASDIEPIKSATDLDAGASWLYQWGLLTQRSFRNIMRLPQAFKVRLFVIIITGLLMDIIYAGSDPNTEAGSQNINGSLFFATMVLGFAAA